MSSVLPRTTVLIGMAGNSAGASAVLDLIGSTRGSILYRGASAWSALTPGTAGYVLQSQGAGADPIWTAVSGAGLGDFSGPASSTDGEIVRFDGITGKNGKATGNATLAGNLTVSGGSIFGSGSAGSGALATVSPGSNGVTTITRTNVNGAGPVGVLQVGSDAKTIGDSVQVLFIGKDSGSADQVYASLSSSVLDPTAGSEDGDFVIRTMTAGSLTTAATFVGANTTLAGNLTVNGTGQNSVVGNFTFGSDGTSAVTRTGINGVGPVTVFNITSDAKTVNDSIGLSFNAKDSGSAAQVYGSIRCLIEDPTAGSEDAAFEFYSVVGGSGSVRAFYVSALNGVIQKVAASAAALSVNSTMTLELTSNTTLSVKVRGTDGTTRTGTITLS